MPPKKIKQQTSSSSMANESQEAVYKEENNKLKRKLQEVEPELAEYKRKFEEAKAELDLEKKKQLAAVADIKFRPKRARISLTVPNFANPTADIFHPDPVEVAAFQWKLRAIRDGKSLGILLYVFSPEHYQGPFEIEVDCSYRLINTFTSNDIHKEVYGCKMNRIFLGYGYAQLMHFAEIEDLLNRDNGFLQADGSVQMEVDFTVKAATLDHLLLADPAADNGESDDE